MPKSRIHIQIILSFLIIALIISGCGERRRAITPSKEGEKPRDIKETQKELQKPDAIKAEFRKAEIIWNDEQGRTTWKARFKEASATSTEDVSIVELRRVEATFYKDGKIASSMIAPRVVADSKTREVSAYGGVKVVSSKSNAVARCQRLTWKSKDGKIYGQGGVSMTNKNMTVNADSFIADASLEKARFTGAELKVKR